MFLYGFIQDQSQTHSTVLTITFIIKIMLHFFNKLINNNYYYIGQQYNLFVFSLIKLHMMMIPIVESYWQSIFPLLCCPLFINCRFTIYI